jgi:hypothetical protein
MATATATSPNTQEPLFALLQIVEGEYREMPCLRLTKAQMQRLWSVESVLCNALVDALVAAQVLRRTPDGSYVAAQPGQ